MYKILIVNTPIGRGAEHDDAYLRRAAIKARIPYVTTIAAGTFDTLPHCGALHSYATITKQKLKDFYWDVFVTSVVCPVGAVALAIIAAKLLGLEKVI